jgi:hypothetical protein
MNNVLNLLNLDQTELKFNTIVNIITSMEEHEINVQVEFMSSS